MRTREWSLPAFAGGIDTDDRRAVGWSASDRPENLDWYLKRFINRGRDVQGLS